MSEFIVAGFIVLLVVMGVCSALWLILRAVLERFEAMHDKHAAQVKDAITLGIRMGYRKSKQEVPPEVVGGEDDDALAQLSKMLREEMGQNGEVEEFNQVPTDDLGYPDAGPPMQSHNNFRKSQRVRDLQNGVKQDDE